MQLHATAFFHLHSLAIMLCLLYSFHVGSGCYDAEAYGAAVMSARTVFDMAQEQGFHFDLLDIGGGFPGQTSAKLSFEEVLVCVVIS
jgi:diaminopimelate decarboxylase